MAVCPHCGTAHPFGTAGNIAYCDGCLRPVQLARRKKKKKPKQLGLMEAPFVPTTPKPFTPVMPVMYSGFSVLADHVVDAAALASGALHAEAEDQLNALSGDLFPEAENTSLVADEDTWIAKDKNTGKLSRVRVADMTEGHLRRWIMHFRKKAYDNGFTGPHTACDAMLKATMVTAPAIYREAKLRGCMPTVAIPTSAVRVQHAKPPVAKPEPVLRPGERLITLPDE